MSENIFYYDKYCFRKNTHTCLQDEQRILLGEVKVYGRTWFINFSAKFSWSDQASILLTSAPSACNLLSRY
jgi:hypothetical protein